MDIFVTLANSDGNAMNVTLSPGIPSIRTTTPPTNTSTPAGWLATTVSISGTITTVKIPYYL